MPSIPKWLGDTMETVFSNFLHPVEVTNITSLHPRLKKVRFEGDLSRATFTAGNVVQFRVNNNDYRHFTPCLLDKEKGICEILFYLHDKGPGSEWADKLQTGDKLRLRGPGGHLQYRSDSKYHFFFGDETSLGLVQCMKQQIHENQQEYMCLLELENDFSKWPSFAGIVADVVHKSSLEPAVEAIQWINLFLDMDNVFWNRWQEMATFYLTGNAQSIQAFRKALREQGVASSQIITQPYWAEGKKGL
ncbi:MAG: siderophore-interacting protein [Chitinophagaceae bacterium]